MPLPASNSRASQRLRAAADQTEVLENALPRAYREEGVPDLAELAVHADAIDDHRRAVLDTAVVLATRPHPAAAERTETRALTVAAERLARAGASIGRAATMAARLHEVDGVGGQAAEETRERATRHVHHSLSHTRIALREAIEQLRYEAERLSLTAPTGRNPAAVARSTARGARVIAAPSPRPADLQQHAAGRRR
ncbi:hypothetical protein [Kitasatospora sp. NRRL B-11411]|uniref:hypothetical protein n=1 Tax=Kitasatospora sp. NRRL B-11411 TaxID=1463822 RepID=UPI0012FE8C0B|nr:hypothetical protein [Kitasatospora sp. NRRL B-11411]